MIRRNKLQLIHNAVQSGCQPTGKVKRNVSPPHCSHKCCCKLHPTKQYHTKCAHRIRTTDSRCNNSAKASAVPCHWLSVVTRCRILWQKQHSNAQYSWRQNERLQCLNKRSVKKPNSYYANGNAHHLRSYGKSGHAEVYFKYVYNQMQCNCRVRGSKQRTVYHYHLTNYTVSYSLALQIFGPTHTLVHHSPLILSPRNCLVSLLAKWPIQYAVPDTAPHSAHTCPALPPCTLVTG